MAKSRNASKSKRPSVKKTLHLDALADGVLESLAVVRKRTNSEIICELLLAELHKLQGPEREAVRAVLAALNVEIPRRKNGTPDDARAGQGGDDGTTPADGLTARMSQIGNIGATALGPVDDSIDDLVNELDKGYQTRNGRLSN